MVGVLLVDDDKHALQAFEAILIHAGHQVQAVTSGAAALDALFLAHNEMPDLIITDIKMPGMTGLELRETIRSHAQYKHIPFLLISASISSELERQLVKLDQTTYLRKPFRAKTLCDIVAGICQRV